MGADSLSIVFMQDERRVEPIDENGYSTVYFNRPEFSVLFPDSDDAIYICAGDNSEIFTLSGADNPFCYGRYRSMALPMQPAEKRWPLRLSTGNAHSYYDSTRTISRDGYKTVYLKGIKSKRPIGNKIFLAVYIDKNRNKEVEKNEIGQFVLVFPEKVAAVGEQQIDLR